MDKLNTPKIEFERQLLKNKKLFKVLNYVILFVIVVFVIGTFYFKMKWTVIALIVGFVIIYFFRRMIKSERDFLNKKLENL